MSQLEARDRSRFLNAVARAHKGQWQLAEFLLEVLPARTGPRRLDDALLELGQLARDNGFSDYSPARLRKLRELAVRFDPSERPESITLAEEAGTPAVLRKAERMAEDEGVATSKRQVRQVRTAVHHDARKAAGITSKAKRAPSEHVRAAAARPTSQTRRTADVLALGSTADKAARLGRQFVEALAGHELTADETEELLSDIDVVLATWKAARNAVRSPLSREAADFLKEVGA